MPQPLGVTTSVVPSGEACVARRHVSNTPLQSLTLLNDVMFMEAALALAKVTAVQSGSMEEKVRGLFLRPATAEETASIAVFFASQEARVKSGTLDAAKVTSDGHDATLAAWTLAVRASLNTDEFVSKH